MFSTCIKKCSSCDVEINFRTDLYNKHRDRGRWILSEFYIGYDSNNRLVCDLLFCDNCFVSVCAFCGGSAYTCLRCSKADFHVNFCKTCCPNINIDGLLGCTHYNCLAEVVVHVVIVVAKY